MKIISTNIGKPTKFIWNDKEETTGIYKKPTGKPIYLTRNDVVNDEVSDRTVVSFNLCRGVAVIISEVILTCRLTAQPTRVCIFP